MVRSVIEPHTYETNTDHSYEIGTRPEIPLSCPTSNCTFPEYETLAVCSSCSEVSHLLDISFSCMENATIDWSAGWTGPLSDVPYPNGTVCGYFLNSTSETPILLSGYIAETFDAGAMTGETLLVRHIPLTDFNTKEPLYGVGSVNYKHIGNPLLDALVVSAANGSESVYAKQAPLVQECILSWCVQSIKSSYDWGKYSENVTSTHLNIVHEASAWPWEVSETEKGQDLVYTQNITLEPHIQRTNGTVFDSTYTVDNVTMFTAMMLFDDFFPSSYTTTNDSETPILRFRNYADGPSTREFDTKFNAWQAPNNLTHYMERFALALTNTIRSSADKQMTFGEAYNKENYVSVRWEWLTLPLGLLFISLIFLAATVAKSAVERDRVGVWKTSAYATLLYGLPDDMQHKITRSGSTGTPRAKAKELKVKLQGTQGWRVSGNLFSPFVTKPRPNQPPPGWI